MSALKTDELRAMAAAADKDGQHIYTHWRDSNAHKANELWCRAASPELVVGLLDRIAELEAQQALKPLTPAQAKKILKEAGYENSSAQEKADFINGIRHGEIAHGITAAQKGDAHGQPT